MISKQNCLLSLGLQYTALVQQTLWCQKCIFENPASTACIFPGSLSFPTVNRSSGNDAALNTPQELGVYDSHMLILFATVPPAHCVCCAEVLSILVSGSQQMMGSKFNSSKNFVTPSSSRNA